MSVKFSFRHRDAVDVYAADADVNGNPRYVVHFLAFDRLRPADVAGEPVWVHNERWIANVREALGGKSYRGKDFGGGIAFTSFSVENDLDAALFGQREGAAMRVRDAERRDAARQARMLLADNPYERPRVTVSDTGEAWDIAAWDDEDYALVSIVSGSAPSYVDMDVDADAWLAAFDAALADAGWMRAGGWLRWLPGPTAVRVVPNELI